MDVDRARAALALHPDPELADAVRTLRLSLDPDAAREFEREQRYRTGAYSSNVSGRKSRGQGAPQCAACRVFRSSLIGPCESCGYVDGVGYSAVPAKTSHLERWR